MDRAQKFIELYNQLSERLTAITGINRYETFSRLIELAAQKDAAIKYEAANLKKYGDLRNAIVHNNETIAEPTELALSKFEATVKKVLSPKRLIPTFQKDIRLFSSDEPLISALKYMRGHDFSQVVVLVNDVLSLLTVEDIAKWLEQEAEEDIISIKEATIRGILLHESRDSFEIMSRNQNIYDARDSFARTIEYNKPRLFAIIITANGKMTEKPLGILTPWDLLEDSSV